MPSPGFDPESPQPQSKSNDLDRSAMDPLYISKILLLLKLFLNFPWHFDAVLPNSLLSLKKLHNSGKCS